MNKLITGVATVFIMGKGRKSHPQSSLIETDRTRVKSFAGTPGTVPKLAVGGKAMWRYLLTLWSCHALQDDIF